MGILDGMATILRANINALLDQAEDPEKTLDQLLRDMADAIGQARGQVAEMIAQEKLLEADMERNTNLSREWGQKAELAVSRGGKMRSRAQPTGGPWFPRHKRAVAQQKVAQPAAQLTAIDPSSELARM